MAMKKEMSTYWIFLYWQTDKKISLLEFVIKSTFNIFNKRSFIVWLCVSFHVLYCLVLPPCNFHAQMLKHGNYSFYFYLNRSGFYFIFWRILPANTSLLVFNYNISAASFDEFIVDICWDREYDCDCIWDIFGAYFNISNNHRIER